MHELISIRDAAAQGIKNVRLDKWANPADHIEIPILADGSIGPWFKLWSPVNDVIGAPNPQTLLCTMMGDLDEKIWRPFEDSKQKATELVD